MYLRRWSIILLAMLFLVACSSSKPSIDADVVTPDGETPAVDDAVSVEEDEMVVEQDEIIPDADNAVCLDLRVYDNVKAAGFPLKDANGKITFCRSGCDTPTENDPQCARNLWDWLNWKHYQEYLNGKNGADFGSKYNYKECYPWPCVLPEVKSNEVSYSPCDHTLGSNDLHADSGTLYDLRVENGFIGGEMLNGGIGARTLVFDIANNTFMSIASSGNGTGYRAGRLIFYSITNDVMSRPEEGIGNTYIFSAKKNATGYKYELIYDDLAHMARFSRPPLVGEKWVVLNIEHRTSGMQEVVYAKVDEWQWHDLKFGKVYEGNIVDNRLTFITDQREIYVCDLDKLPFDPSKECTRIDRAGETAYQPRLNEEDKNQLVYFAGVGEYGITLVDLSEATPQYTLLPATSSETQAMGTYPHQFKGALILYDEMFMPINEETRADYKACFYRIDLKKNYCPSKPSFSDGRYDQGYNSFDNKFQLWKVPSAGLARFRDIQCYCEKEGVCPFEGLTAPQPYYTAETESPSQRNTPPTETFVRTEDDTYYRLMLMGALDKDGYEHLKPAFLQKETDRK